MAYCDKCGNYDESHRDSMDYEKDSHLEAQNYEPDFLDEASEYWEDHFDEVVKDIKEYANSKFKNPMGDRNVN